MYAWDEHADSLMLDHVVSTFSDWKHFDKKHLINNRKDIIYFLLIQSQNQ